MSLTSRVMRKVLYTVIWIWIKNKNMQYSKNRYGL